MSFTASVGAPLFIYLLLRQDADVAPLIPLRLKPAPLIEGVRSRHPRAIGPARSVLAGGASWWPCSVPNGSGKSTLLGALAGILPATGMVRLCGEAVSELSWPELALRRAMLPQRQPQLFSYSGVSGAGP